VLYLEIYHYLAKITKTKLQITNNYQITISKNQTAFLDLVLDLEFQYSGNNFINLIFNQL